MCRETGTRLRMNISDSALRLSIYLSCLLVYSFDIPLSYFYCSGKNLGRSVPVPCIDRGPSQGSRVRGAFSSGRSGDQMSHYSEQDRERPIGMYGKVQTPMASVCPENASESARAAAFGA